MPLSTTLEALHEAIQMTMGWTFSHLWDIGCVEEARHIGCEARLVVSFCRLESFSSPL